jgi:Cdc6-like AAA superfamily ATPase
MAELGFVAYPETEGMVRDAIEAAVDLSATEPLRLKPWSKMQIIGFKLDELIRDHISEAAVLLADITYANANVYYEIGYAIAVGKPVIPLVNVAIDKSIQRIQRTGLFDTIGWATYNNSEELRYKLREWRASSWTSNYVRRRNHGQPLFILDTFSKTEFRNHIFHAVDNSQVRFRSFDPAEVPRLTASQAVADISSSAGVILPILDNEIIDADLHNLRASFLLGLCHGYGIEALAIQYGHGPAPLDYRDFITNSTYKHETEKHVTEFAAEVLIWNQDAQARGHIERLGLLAEIDIGSPMAENETQSLADYFVQTAEYARAMRSEGAVITGRKGSGKSAVALRISQEVLRQKKSCLIDLRPASHHLSEMREALLSIVTAGAFDHTIAAFWQYVIYIEIVLKFREMALPRSKSDFALQERIRNIESEFRLGEGVVSGDFTSRLETAVKKVIASASDSKDAADLRSRLTNALFELPIPHLRDAVCSFLDFTNEVVILIDDLDKGWPPRQVEPHDIAMVKHLIEALNRIQRDLGRRKVEVKHLVFLRSDIYERLVEETSDRGKYNIIKVDWSDPEQLRNLLRRRVTSRIEPAHHQSAWDSVNPVLQDGTDAVTRMIEGSLRRPRFLIDLCERVLSFAINRGHAFVSEEDVNEGLRQMSLYLVSDFGYEMRDIAGTPEDIFYLFIGSPELVTEEEITKILTAEKTTLSISEVIDLLLWYGFLGIVTETGSPVYIYNRAYDFRRLLAERPEQNGERLYSINPAFLMGLKKDQTQ